MTNDITRSVTEFLEQFTAALGVKTEISVERTSDGPRLNIGGDEAEILVRRRGEPLKALQHIVDTAYGRALPGEQRVFVDALEYRKGKDVELRRMARFLAEKAQQTGLDQQLGPLNPYERRIVHLAVAEVPGDTTESIGDAFSKTVLISARRSTTLRGSDVFNVRHDCGHCYAAGTGRHRSRSAERARRPADQPVPHHPRPRPRAAPRHIYQGSTSGGRNRSNPRDVLPWPAFLYRRRCCGAQRAWQPRRPSRNRGSGNVFWGPAR